MKLRLALAAATCLVLPIAAHAQPVTGPYVSLGAGTSILNPTTATQEGGTAVGDIFFKGQSDRYQFKPSYAGAASVGYGFGDGFRVEISADYIRNTANASDETFPGDSFTYHGNTTGAEKKYGAMANVLYDVPVGLPVFPYFGAGVGYQFVKYNSDLAVDEGSPGFPAAFKTGGTKGSFAYNLIAGLSYPLPMVPGLSLTIEYRFMQLVESRSYQSYAVNLFAQGNTYAAGKAKVGQESSHTLLAGIRYQIFNPPPAAPVTPTPAPAAAPAPAPAKTYLVFFDWDKYNLTPRAMTIISQAASDSKSQQVTTLEVSGYTDTSGTPNYNQGLSERRAHAVAMQLVADGVPDSEIETHGYGETHLLVPTGPGVREPQNRRVEIVLQ